MDTIRILRRRLVAIESLLNNPSTSFFEYEGAKIQRSFVLAALLTYQLREFDYER